MKVNARKEITVSKIYLLVSGEIQYALHKAGLNQEDILNPDLDDAIELTLRKMDPRDISQRDSLLINVLSLTNSQPGRLTGNHANEASSLGTFRVRGLTATFDSWLTRSTEFLQSTNRTTASKS